jgi:hypothetical protein
MPHQLKAIAFDLDEASLISLRKALPGWQVDVLYGATVASLPCYWNPGGAELLIVGVRAIVSETLGLCRFLAFCTPYSKDFRQEARETLGLARSLSNGARRTAAPLLVLVPAGQEALVSGLLEAGAHSCLMLPIHAKEVASMLVHARAGNQPGRHTLHFERAQSEDRWRDDGGQG